MYQEELRDILDKREISRRRLRQLLESLAPKKRGQHPAATFSRDTCIVGLVRVVAKLFNVSITRNQASEVESAASIVCEALEGSPQELSEQRLNRLYHAHKRRNPWIILNSPVEGFPADFPPQEMQDLWEE